MLTEPDHYPLPNIADVTTYLHGEKIFLKLDLLKGYYQVPMNPPDIPKTTITTPFGTYTFNYSCFGLRNAGTTFKHMMNNVLSNLPFCINEVDDILVFYSRQTQTPSSSSPRSPALSWSHHPQHKCVFWAKSVEFLGHHISSKGFLPLQEKVAAVRSIPTLSTVKSLREFVGW